MANDLKNAQASTRMESPQSSEFDVEKTTSQQPSRVQKWRGMVVTILLTSIINGYDVSNIASLQPRLYEEFGRIEILPWVGLSYSLALFSSLSLARKVIYFANMRHVYLCGLVTFIAGAGAAGAAPSMPAVIAGRAVMGIGGAVVQQCNMSYMALFATSLETPSLFAQMSAMWAVGVVVGAPIGSAFAANAVLTWRWALYINIPFVGLGLAFAAYCAPSHVLRPGPIRERLARLDPVGVLFNMITPSLFALALTLSGPLWAWGSNASIGIWVAFFTSLVLWSIQQYFCILTTTEDRAFPLHILPRRDLQPIWVASACAGSTYAVTLYYTPLFFAFTRRFGPLQQTVRILPFILVFIFVVLLTGTLLPRVGKRYGFVYVAAGVVTASSAATLAVAMRQGVSDAQVMACVAVIGLGLGMHFQHGAAIISNAHHEHDSTEDSDDNLQRAQVDSLAVFNLAQMGGIAVTLTAASAVFENVGYHSLVHVIGSERYTSHEIREALAGVSSSVWQSADTRVLQKCVEAVASVIAKEFYIVTASAVICLVCGLLMLKKWPGKGNATRTAG